MIDRYTAIQAILRRVNPEDLVLSTTGMISREVFVTNDRPGNFYMIGSMGLLSSFGLGLALQFPEKKVYILEGDGSALMSLGSLPLIATESPKNLFHVILDNEAYESTGSQPSITSKIDLDEIAKSSGYPDVARAEDLETLEAALSDCDTNPGLYQYQVGTGIRVPIRQSVFQGFQVFGPDGMGVSAALGDLVQVNLGAYRWLGSRRLIRFVIQNDMKQVVGRLGGNEWKGPKTHQGAAITL